MSSIDDVSELCVTGGLGPKSRWQQSDGSVLCAKEVPQALAAKPLINNNADLFGYIKTCKEDLFVSF